MDPNRNRAAVAFDALGMVVGTAVMGKPEENLGDSLTGFVANLTDAVILDHLANPLAGPHAILGRATTRLVYDLFAYHRTKDQPEPRPVVVYALARETHEADLSPGQPTKVQHSFSYSDGFGREIQEKIQAEPGPAPQRDASGKIIVGADGQPVMTASDVSPRWVGSGWTVFNNKGKPVRQYEPFFTDTHRFEFDMRIGVSPVLFYDSAERVVATLHPNHTWEKVVFDPWRQETWDVNDTVLVADPKNDNSVGDFFERLPDAEYLPTWHAQRQGGGLGPQEQTAANKAAIHANTPTVTHLDSLGRTFLTVAHNKFKYSNTPPAAPPAEEFYATRIVFDIEGNQRGVIDSLERVVMRYHYDLLGNRIHQASMEAGERWMLSDVAGNPLYAWDSRDHRFRMVYDRMRRPADALLRAGAAAEQVVGRSTYGETRPNPEAKNLRGEVVEVRDQAGVVTSDDFDFKGNLLSGRRQLAQSYNTTLNWSGAVPFEVETYTSRTRYDALNRTIQLIAPHSDQPGTTVNVIQPVYNEANLLEQVNAWLNRNAEPADVLDPATANLNAVTNIDYDAKGQRARIEYGNGVRTTYEYDPLTFRLTHIRACRDPATFANDCPQPPPSGWPGCQVQNLHYTYDPTGNITHIHDDAQQTIYFRNRRVEPSAEYTYDAVYRLIEATGREHLGQTGGGTNAPTPHSYNDAPRVGLLHPGDGNAMGSYLERYVYDAVGNFLEMQHRGSNPAHPGWTRAYNYNETSLLEAGNQSNRLTSTTIGGTTETYSTAGNGYDAHGNMLRLPHLQVMQWDFKDQLQMTQRQAVNPADADGGQLHGERTWYVYDSAGERVRKVTELGNGQVKDQRIYLGGFEIYRRNGANPLVRETLHIMDDKQRIAMMETRIQGNEPGLPSELVRYQLGNHLGSACLEVDDQARVLSYEEYTPYGSTAYQAVRSQIQTPKRYRFTGMERDEESGLSYHSARYYAPWLGRWTSADPLGLVDGPNLYRYARNTPLVTTDPQGTDPPVVNSGNPNDPRNYVFFDDFRAGAVGPWTDEALRASWDEAHATTTPEAATTADEQRDPWTQTAGSGAVTIYNTAQRSEYLAQVRTNSAQGVQRVQAARGAGDLAAAEAAARETSATRNALRTATQERLTPGSRYMSQVLEEVPDFESLAQRYAQPNQFDTFEEVARAAGRSRGSVTTLTRVGKVAGPAGVAFGVGVGVYEVVEAPPAERPRVAAREGGGVLGGAAGAELGFAGGTGLAVVIAGVAGLSGPPGWIVLGLGLVGAGAGGYFGSEGGRAAGGALYDASQSHDAQRRQEMNEFYSDPYVIMGIGGP
ncbi:MAG TPA: RHS repeat-associated core domain-containing protein [Dehalococcoidia bacterium]|nr:RHS repeat-associated core domain-containing protein [Dehalococcoidia bacterium]